MNYELALLLMIVGHCVGDYVLQTNFMAEYKSPRRWDGAPDKNAWIPVLLAHSVIWTACVMLPLLLLVWPAIGLPFVICFVANVAIHFFVDWLKCVGKTNMLIDQGIHLAQMIATFALVALL